MNDQSTTPARRLEPGVRRPTCEQLIELLERAADVLDFPDVRIPEDLKVIDDLRDAADALRAQQDA